jgi:hypothetical protein
MILEGNISLATLNVLPILVNGKVVVINDNKTYTTYKVAQYTTIKDNFNPWEYCISPIIITQLLVLSMVI